MSKRIKKQVAQASLPVMHPNAAGVDVGSREHFVAVPAERTEEPVRSFGCYTRDLEAMADWLEACCIDTVAMESTGVYWIPAFELLEDRGFKVYLVDARQTKNVSGRKSDVLDCQWIQRLHSFGLLSAAFRPARDIAVVRALSRQRAGLVKSCSRQIHLMQKALDQMNVHLHKAITDITGTTGTRIIEAILGGERDPLVLARLRHPFVKKPEAEIAQALRGTYRSEHMFVLRQAYEGFQFFQAQLVACDASIQEHLAALPASAEEPVEQPVEETKTKKPSTPKRRKNEPHFDLKGELRRISGVDLTAIPGINANTAHVLLTECGVDMGAFPTEKHFASWLGLCPNNRKTGGAIRSTRTRKVSNRAATALRVAAQSLHRSKTALGAYYRRMRTRLGAPKAITATAHKLARLVYRMLNYGQEYVERGQDYYENKYRDRVLRNLAKTAKQLDLQLVDEQTGQIVS
jgi:transposase